MDTKTTIPDRRRRVKFDFVNLTEQDVEVSMLIMNPAIERRVEKLAKRKGTRVVDLIKECGGQVTVDGEQMPLEGLDNDEIHRIWEEYGNLLAPASRRRES